MTAPVRALLLAAGTLVIAVPGLAQSQLSATPNPVALNGTNLNVQVAVSGAGPFTVQTSGSFFSVSTGADTAPATFTVSVTNTVCSNGNVPCNGSITLHPTAPGGGTDVSIPVTFTPGAGGGVGSAPILANPNPVTLTAFPNQSVTTTVTLSTNSVTPIPFNVSFSPQNSWLLVTVTNSQVSANGTSPGSATMTVFANATGITTSQTGSITLTPTNGSPQTVIPVALNITGSTGSTYSANPPNAALVYPGSPQSQQVTVNSNNFNVSTFNAQVANCSGGNFLLLTTASGSGTLLTNQSVSGALVLSLVNPQIFATGSYSCQVVVSNPANPADQIVIPVILTVNGGGGSCTQPLCVNRTDDNAVAPVFGMLRYAVLNAPKGAVITFDPALNGQTILLDITSPNNPIRIGQDLTIRAPGALTISGGSSTRIFFIAGGNVTISGLTLANGLGKGFDGASGGNGGGGAAGMGGAIFMNGGFLTLSGVVFSGNRAQGGNGGQGTGGGGNSGGGGGFASAGFGGQGGNGGDLGGIGGAPGPSGTVGLPGISGGNGAGGGGGGNSSSAPGAGGNGGFAAGGGAGGIGCFAVSGGPNGGSGAGGIGGFGAGSGAGSSSGASFGGGSGAVVSNTANCAAVAGGGGGGGAAFGGAIFVSAGSLLAVNTTFLSNVSVGATGGNGAGSGQSKGGALFVCSTSFCGAGHDSSVIFTGSTLFQGNAASSGGAATLCPGRDDSDVCGSLTSSVPTHFSVSAPVSVTPSGPFSYTVTALDAANNIVFTYAGLVHFSSSDSQASLPGDSTLTAGVGTFTAVLNTLGNQTISATDTAALFVTGTSAPIAVSNSGAFSAVSVNPSFGGGLSSSFNFVFNDSNGAQDLDVVNILINNFLDGRQACYLAYSVPQNVLYLVNDAGTALQSGLVLNGAGDIGNSQCNVIGFGSTAQKNGSFLTLTLNLTFSAAFGGNKVVYLAARSLTQNTGWQPLGVWTVPGAPATSPSVGAVTPARGSGLNQSFTFNFADSFGKTDIGIVNILINNALDGRQSCYLAYSRPLNTLYLVNDAGSGLLPGLTLNGSGSTSNSQCAVNGSLSSVSATGSPNVLALMLNITFAPTFGGNRIVYVAARNLTDTSNSGWQAAATWTVQ